jgi:CRISPR-associated protein Csy3
MSKAKTDMVSLETGMLSFARSLQPSEGLFWGTRSGDKEWRQPIEVYEKGVRGQSSEFKTDNPGKSNPQVVEAAAIPLGCDGVALTFSMWVSPFAMKPWACGNADVSEAYERLAKAYAKKGGFGVLARLFLWNIANGRFAWRNRYQSDDMRVTVEFDGRSIAFDPTRLELETPATLDAMCQAVPANEPDQRDNVAALADWIAEGLTTKHRPLSIAWQAAMKEGEEIFPSQEYLRAELREKAASRVYAKLPRFHRGQTIMQASMHSQKIGAALRHIDVWHGDVDPRAIAVNPYGGVQETGHVLRKPKTGRSFYELRADAGKLMADVEAASDAEALPEAAHFVVANLVRGGVFGQKGEA